MMKLVHIKKQNGFSLVEVLIALVIMSVGMLGIAGLYVQSMQAGRTSMFRHHAVTLAGDVADRIRANPTAGAAYNHIDTYPGTNFNCVAMATDCNVAEMAENDIFIWQNEANDTLPGGEVAVTFAPAVAAAPPTYQVTVTWDEPNPLGGQTPSYTFTIPVMPL